MVRTIAHCRPMNCVAALAMQSRVIGLFPHRTVAQNIATVPTLLGWSRKRIDERVEELLGLFQLKPAQFGPRYPHELSGGQQQRVGSPAPLRQSRTCC